MAKPPMITRLEASDRVRQVEVPPDARARSTLTRIDYEDAFLLDVSQAPDRTAEQWARMAVEEAPASVRHLLRSGWASIGLKLDGAPPDRSVLGWEIRRSTPEFVLLGADSRLTMAGELLFERRQHELLFCTFVQQEDESAREVWARIEPNHVAIVRHVLGQAAARAASTTTRPGFRQEV